MSSAQPGEASSAASVPQPSMQFFRWCTLLDAIRQEHQRAKKFEKLHMLWNSMDPNESKLDLMRLLLPGMDSERGGRFGLKEVQLAKLYIRILGVAPDSLDAKRLLKWKDAAFSHSGTTFPDALDHILKQKGFPESPFDLRSAGLSLRVVNEVLDALCQTDSQEGRESIFREVTRKMTRKEQVTFTRLILRDLRLGIKDETILGAFHPAAVSLFNSCTNLVPVLEKLSDPETAKQLLAAHTAAKGPGAPPGLSTLVPGHHFKPMLASPAGLEELASNFAAGGSQMCYFVEPKYDGERLQAHVVGSSCKLFSRNGKDYTSLYHSIATAIVEAKVSTCQSVVFDGEVLVWDTVTNQWCPFGYNKTFARLHQGAKRRRSPSASRSHPADIDVESDGVGSVSAPRGTSHRGALSRTGSSAVPLGDGAVSEASLQPHQYLVYKAFDIMHLNGRDLTSLPLKERKQILASTIVAPAASRGAGRAAVERVSVVQYAKKTSLRDILECLDEELDLGNEGIMIKIADSCYVPNERGSKWLKLKSDGISGLTDTIDVVVLGAYFGTKFGKRHLSHFLIGVPVGASDTGGSGVFWTCGKVGSGYSAGELEQLLANVNWLDSYDPQHPPAFLDGWVPFTTSDTPDKLLNPDSFRVIEVTGVSLNHTTKFKTQLTLRFPRYKRTRWDKSPADATSLTALHDLASKCLGRRKAADFAEQAIAAAEARVVAHPNGPVSKYRHQRNRATRGVRVKLDGSSAFMKTIANPVLAKCPSLDEMDIPEDPSEKCGIFQDQVIYIVDWSAEYPKELLSEALKRAGAHVVAVPNPASPPSFAVGVKKPSESLRVRRIVESFPNLDIVHAQWVVACLSQGCNVQITRKWVIHASPETEAELYNLYDEYGDPYTTPINAEEFVAIYRSTKMQNSSRNGDTDVPSLKVAKSEPSGLGWYCEPEPTPLYAAAENLMSQWRGDALRLGSVPSVYPLATTIITFFPRPADVFFAGVEVDYLEREKAQQMSRRLQELYILSLQATMKGSVFRGKPFNLDASSQDDAVAPRDDSKFRVFVQQHGITHVVVDEDLREFAGLYFPRRCAAHMVRPSWLRECISSNSIVDETVHRA